MKISIIVSVYNTPKTNLERCVRSLQNQTYKDIEIMLIDKGSTDASKVYCNNYSKLDDRIRSISSNDYNEVINMCDGEYITFVDSNDYLELKAIETLLDEIDNNINLYIAKENSNNTIINTEKDKEYDIENLYSKLYKKSLIEKINFTSVKEFNKQVLLNSKYVVIINKKIYNESNKKQSFINLIRTKTEILNKPIFEYK